MSTSGLSVPSVPHFFAYSFRLRRYCQSYAQSMASPTRNRACLCGIQYRDGSVADACRIFGRSVGRAGIAGRRPRDWGERLCDCRPRRFILGVGRHVCARRCRQYGLSPGRLCAAVAACAIGSHWSGVFGPHICRHARFCRCSCDVAHDAEPLGLARRLYWRWRARLCRRCDPRNTRSIHRAGITGLANPGCDKTARAGNFTLCTDPAQSRFFRAARDDQQRSYNYSVVALGALYGTPATVATTAPSGNLLWSAIGVIGGLLVVAPRAWHCRCD